MDIETLGILGAVIITIVSLFASAFFSGLEFAFISANRLKIALQKNKTGLVPKMLTRYYDRPNQFLGTTLIGNNITLVIYTQTFALLIGLFMPIFIKQSGFLLLLTETLVTTIFILIFGEFLPKNLVRLSPTSVLKVSAIPFAIVYYLLYFIVLLVVYIAKLLLRMLFGIKYEVEQKALARIDLRHFIEQIKSYSASSEDSSDKIMLFEKALAFPEIKVRDCMVPRTEIDAIDIKTDIEQIKQAFIDSGHSKLVVYQDNIDHIIGYIHHQDLLKNKVLQKKEYQSRFWTMPKVPETLPAENLMQTFIKERKSIAWVIDEYGGTAGIITLEDIIEEIFGEIRDEHDAENLTETVVREGKEYIFAARLEVDYLNEKYNLQIPEGEYETLAGFIVTHLESIPKKDQRFQIDRFEAIVLEASKIRVDTIRLILLNDEQ